MQFYLYILLLVGIDICAITTSKQWQVSGKIYWLIISMILFALMPIIFARATRYTASGVANAVWVAASSILITIAGYFIFKEHLTWMQIAGLLIIIAGLVVLRIK